MSWLRRLVHGSTWDGTSGTPRSANAASSFHLFWDAPEGSWTSAAVVVEVSTPPSVPSLYFWALQVSFVERGRAAGGAHLGLQWYPPHPGSTAVNWGGYASNGHELNGSASILPSATGNPNTRDFAWSPARAYRLAITRGRARADGAVAWRGSITDVETGHEAVVRDLYAHGTHLETPMVWSEVFADCDAAAVEVRWRDLALGDEEGDQLPIATAVVSYQAVADGGCATTDSSVVGGAFVQRTGTTRRVRPGARLTVEA